MKDKYTFIQPTYYNDFNCSSDKCNINCCNYGWNITIDKKTYKKYRAVAEPKEFVDKLNKYVKRNRNSKSDLDYARIIQYFEEAEIKFTSIENNKKEVEVMEKVACLTCVFQDENKLCDIYKYLGFQGLSNTCKTFPRIFNCVYDTYERSLSFGCEEVSKLLLAQKEGIKFEVIDVDENPNIYKNYQSNLTKTNLSRETFDQMRIACLQILQSDISNLDGKIILLGALCFKLDKVVQDEGFCAIPNTIEAFFENLDVYEPVMDIKIQRQDKFLEMFIKLVIYVSGKGGRADITFDIQNVLAKFKLAYTSKKIKLPKILSIKTSDGTEIDSDSLDQSKFNILFEDAEVEDEAESPLETLEDGSVVSKIYQKYKENTIKLMEGYEQYVENLIVHLFFSKCYPFNGKNSIKDSYIKLVWIYCYYKGLTTGIVGERDTLDEELLHRICTIFGRTCADQELGLNKVLKNIKDNDLDTLSFMAVLINSC